MSETLHVFLSGGASSLAWLPTLSPALLEKKLRTLYRAQLDIRELNRERAKLCRLKAGGAARLTPTSRIKVFAVSDVAPFSVKYLGSGPFHCAEIPHRVLADNPSWVKSLSRLAREPVVTQMSGLVGSWQDWITKMGDSFVPGISIFGGEPSLRLPTQPGRGGRQTHLALALLLKFHSEIRSGRLEILCRSSDGRDGSSGKSGIWLGEKTVSRRWNPTRARDYLREFNSLFGLPRKSLIPSHSAEINVQDVVLVRAPISPRQGA